MASERGDESAQVGSSYLICWHLIVRAMLSTEAQRQVGASTTNVYRPKAGDMSPDHRPNLQLSADHAPSKERTSLHRWRQLIMIPETSSNAKSRNPPTQLAPERFLRLSQRRLFIFDVPAKKGGRKKQLFWLCASCSQTLTLKCSINNIELVQISKSTSGCVRSFFLIAIVPRANCYILRQEQ